MLAGTHAAVAKLTSHLQSCCSQLVSLRSVVVFTRTIVDTIFTFIFNHIIYIFVISNTVITLSILTLTTTSALRNVAFTNAGEPSFAPLLQTEIVL